MKKWKTVRVKQELVKEIEKEVEKSQYPSLSQFVSEAIQLRLQGLAKERTVEYLKRDEEIRALQLQGQIRYTSKHVWVKLTAGGNIQLGVTDYFERRLKGIVYVGGFEGGDTVSEDEPFGTIETVASWPLVIHDLYSPINGKIVKINKKVLKDPYILNGDPYQWIVEIEPTNPELTEDRLLSFEEYEKLSSEEKSLLFTK